MNAWTLSRVAMLTITVLGHLACKQRREQAASLKDEDEPTETPGYLSGDAAYTLVAGLFAMGVPRAGTGEGTPDVGASYVTTDVSCFSGASCTASKGKVNLDKGEADGEISRNQADAFRKLVNRLGKRVDGLGSPGAQLTSVSCSASIGHTSCTYDVAAPAPQPAPQGGAGDGFISGDDAHTLVSGLFAMGVPRAGTGEGTPDVGASYVTTDVSCFSGSSCTASKGTVNLDQGEADGNISQAQYDAFRKLVNRLGQRVDGLGSPGAQLKSVSCSASIGHTSCTYKK